MVRLRPPELTAVHARKVGTPLSPDLKSQNTGKTGTNHALLDTWAISRMDIVLSNVAAAMDPSCSKCFHGLSRDTFVVTVIGSELSRRILSVWTQIVFHSKRLWFHT